MMRRSTQFFSTLLAQAVKTTQQASKPSPHLEKIHQEMQAEFKKKLQDPAYKQALTEARKENAQNAEALEEATKRAEENFRYSY